MASRKTLYTTPGTTQQRFEALLAKNYVGIGQIVGEELTNENIKDKKQTYKQEGTDIVLFRYKIRLCTKLKDTTTNDQCIFAYGQNNGPSGKGGFHFGNWRYADGEFVEVYRHPVTGLFYIDNSVPVGYGVTLTQNRNGTQGCQPLSGYKPGSPTFQVSLANQGSSGGRPINEFSSPHTDDYCKWDELYENMPTITLKTPCEPASLAGLPSSMSGLLKDVQNLRTGLLGNDSFLVTSQDFINKSQEKVSQVASEITGAMTWLIQEIQKQITRAVNTTVNSTIGASYLNTRYQIFEGVNLGLAAINCAFAAILDALADFIADALNNLINDIINAATCAIENFLSDLLTQIINNILNAISSILGGIGQIIGAAINVVDTILGVVESLLNIFEGCPPKQICPADEEWNFLEGIGGDGGNLIDIQGIFSRVNSAVSSFSNAGDAITDFSNINFNFNFDANSALASAGNCFVGPTPCGPPVVRFFGGGASSSATGSAVVNSFGEVIGINITDSGFGYTNIPMIVIEDPCGIGIGARAAAVIGEVEIPPTGTGGIGTGGIGTGVGTAGTGTTGIAVGITSVIMLSTGYGYLPTPDGSRGANGLIYGDRCQTLVQRASGTWDQPYSPGEVMTLETGDRVSLPGLYEIQIEDTVKLQKELIKIGAYVVRINPPLATIPYRSMVGFVKNSTANFFSMEDYNKAKKEGYTDADVRFYLEKNYSGRISPKVQSLLNEPTWGRLVQSPDQYSPKSMISFNQRQYGPNGFDLPDLEFARSKGYTDADVRFFLESNYAAGPISPNMKKLLDTPGWGRTPGTGYTGIRQMFGFDDSAGGKNFFGYKRDYVEAKRRGFSDADIRYYLENHYTGQIGSGMKEALADPKFGKIQGVSNMAGVLRDAAPRDMRSFSDAYGKPGIFGNEDYQEARRQGYSDADIRYYLEKHYGGTIGAMIRTKLNDPAWGRSQREFEFYDDVGNKSFGIFGLFDYEVATRQIESDAEFLNSDKLYEQFVQEGYTDVDIRYYLENYYTGRIGPLMKARLDDPNWGRALPVIPGATTTPPPRIKSMVGFSDKQGRKDEFSTADLDTARRSGFKDVDIRFYLENNYTGYIADGVRVLLSDPNWGRLGQTITVSVTAPGCPEDTVIEDFISTSDVVTSYISGVVVADPGFEYNSETDQIVVTPKNGAELEYESVNGSISNVKVISGGSGFTSLPEITINTNTGYNARIIPILGFNKVDSNNIGVGGTFGIGEGVGPIRIVDCVGKVPPRRQLDIVPE